MPITDRLEIAKPELGEIHLMETLDQFCVYCLSFGRPQI
jgi:uncharacterized membrane protein